MVNIVEPHQPLRLAENKNGFEVFRCQGEPHRLMDAIFKRLWVFFSAPDWQCQRTLQCVVFECAGAEITVAVKSADVPSGTISSPFAGRHPMTDIVIVGRSLEGGAEHAYQLAVDFLRVFSSSYSADEVRLICDGFPLLSQIAEKLDFGNDNVALIFRDHFLEDNLVFLLSCRDAGINPRWIFALSKGDRTLKRDRIASYLKSLHFNVGVFDNAVFDAKVFDENTSSIYGLLEQFVLQAKAAGKRRYLIYSRELTPEQEDQLLAERTTDWRAPVIRREAQGR